MSGTFPGEFATCVCCFEDMREAQVLSCGHAFCKSCWEIWSTTYAQPSCPTCRATSSFVNFELSHLLSELLSTRSTDKLKWELFNCSVLHLRANPEFSPPTLDRDGTFFYDNSQPWRPCDNKWMDPRVLHATGEERERIIAANGERLRIREEAASRSPMFNDFMRNLRSRYT